MIAEEKGRYKNHGEDSHTMNDQNGGQFPWRVFLSELIGTALLVLFGLSLVLKQA